MQFSSLDELLIQRIDDLDDFTRKILHIASIVGKSFSLMEILGITEHALSIPEEEKKDHAVKLRTSLSLAVEGGILDEGFLSIQVDEEVFRIENLYTGAFSEIDGHQSQCKSPETSQIDDLYYVFCHDSWREKILSLLLNSYKRDIHMYIASAIKSSIPDLDASDYRIKLKLFGHLKDGGDTTKAAELALNLGKSFMHLGLNQQSIRVYDEALEIWRKRAESCKANSDDRKISGITYELIESLDESDLSSIIKLLTAMGQASGTLHMTQESSNAFEDALEVSAIFSYFIVQ